ncbi:hypothetical protein [Bosea sp. (in: a-proteobacteria)]
MTHGRGITPPDRRRGAERWPQALLLLLAMCLAVLPHATLAASLMRLPQPARLAETMPRTEARPAAQAAPCHEAREVQDPAPGHAHSAMPACCIAGCGLLAAAPSPALPSRPILWSRPGLAPAEPLSGLSPEPAKPPPRTGATRS